MPHKPIDSGDDDWVKQMLAEAMLGPNPAPSTPEVESTSSEAEQQPPTTFAQPAEFGPVPEEESAGADVSDPIAEAPPQEEAPAPIVESDPVVGVDLAPSAKPVADAGGVADDETDAVSSNRLFERPSFDATKDPGVDSMIRSEVSATTTESPEEERSSARGVIEWIVVLGSAVVVALLLRAFLFQAFYIPSESMEETLLVDDRVLVNKLSYRLHDINRGDVVVFRRPEAGAGEFRDLIKRVIGLPGETIEARDNTIYINGQVLIEPYLTAGEVIADFDPVVIPEGELFVMGDNRDNSGDSRVFGTIDTERVIGRAFFLFWPLDRIGSL